MKDIEDLLKEHIRRGEPREPQEEECCGNGCSPCVWDTYYDKVGKWQDKKVELEEQINDHLEQDDLQP